MSDPWDRNAGKFDRPSSGLPGRDLRAPPREVTRDEDASLRAALRDSITVIGIIHPSGFSLEPPAPKPRTYDDRPGRRGRKTRNEPI